MSVFMQPSLFDQLVGIDGTEIGWLMTFKPCGHVAHAYGKPRTGMWVSCSSMGGAVPGCQTQRQVADVRPCPRLPDCPDCARYPRQGGMP